MAIGFPAISAGSFTLTNDINGSEELSSVVQNLTGAEISTDGTKIFVLERNYTTGSTVVAGSGNVYQYTAPLGWENTGASPTYDNVSFSWISTPGIHSYVNNGTTYTVRKLKFNSSGTRMYILDESDDLFQYNLTSAWDLSTASYSNNTINLGSQSTDMKSIMFNDTGTKMYALGGSDGKIYQYTLSSPFEISTATYDGSAADYIIPQYNSANPNPVDFSFNTDGTKLYILQGYGNAIHRYSLSVAYDTSTTTNDLVMDAINTSFYVGSGHPSGLTSIGSAYSPGFVFNQDGSYVIKLFNEYNSTMGAYITGLQAFAVAETAGVGDGSTFTFNNRDYIYDGTKEAWEVNSPITVAQTGSPVSDLSELADSTSILSDPANEVLTYADLNAILAVTNPATGQLAFNLDTLDMYIFGGTNWQKVYDEDDVPPPASWYGDKAVIAGGYTTSNTRTTDMQTTNIVTDSSTTGFGNLTVARNSFSAASDNTYGLFIAGQGNSSQTNVIDYVVFAGSSGATDFGDTDTAFNGQGAVSDGTNAIHNKGNTLWTVAFATPGNASSFGADSTAPLYQFAGTCNDATYGVWGGGGNNNNMSYINMQTPGTSGDFGDLNMSNEEGSGTDSSSGRGIFAGGKQSNVRTNIIDYIEIATPSNATDFGDLTIAMETASASDGTYGLISTSSTSTTTINKITIDTLGSAVSFGTLGGGARSGTAATSGASS